MIEAPIKRPFTLRELLTWFTQNAEAQLDTQIAYLDIPAGTDCIAVSTGDTGDLEIQGW